APAEVGRISQSVLEASRTDWEIRPTKSGLLGHSNQRGGRQRVKGAGSPRSSSMRRQWVYLASRSPRATRPVLIFPAPVATARSAIVLSSVSPLRAEITVA